MNRKSKMGILSVFIALALNGWLVGPLLAQQEVVVPIEGISSSDKLTHFYNGEELRKERKFIEAIEEYKMVIGGGELCGKEARAHYTIGICYTWLSDLEKAGETFKQVNQTYSDDSKATAFAEYGLAWVEIQQGKYYEAIGRLQQKLDENPFEDYEHCARMQFQIARVYLSYLHDYERGRAALQKVLDLYPNSRISNHPFLDPLR